MKFKTAIITGLIGAGAAYLVVKNNQIPIELGVKGGRLMPLPCSPNGISSQTEDQNRRVEPFPYRSNFQDSKEKLLEAISICGDYHIRTEKEDYLHIVFSSKLGIKDDFEFYFDEEDRRIHVRAASRLQITDFGLNRGRYEDLRRVYLDLETE